MCFTVNIIQAEYIFKAFKIDPNCNEILPVINKIIVIFSPCKKKKEIHIY